MGWWMLAEGMCPWADVGEELVRTGEASLLFPEDEICGSGLGVLAEVVQAMPRRASFDTWSDFRWRLVAAQCGTDFDCLPNLGNKPVKPG